MEGRTVGKRQLYSVWGIRFFSDGLCFLWLRSQVLRVRSVGSLERISGRRWAPIIRLFCSGSLGWMRRRHGYLATAIHVIAAGRLTFLLVGCAQKKPLEKIEGPFGLND